MTPPERIGGSAGFKESPSWSSEQYETLVDNATEKISITVSSNSAPTGAGGYSQNGWAHHGRSGGQASHMFDGNHTDGGKYIIFVDEVAHTNCNTFADAAGDYGNVSGVDGSGNGVILYFTFTGCEEPVYYRWWTANDNHLYGRMLTSWTTVCDWNNNEITYTLSNSAHPDINENGNTVDTGALAAEIGKAKQWNVYPDSPVVGERDAASGTDISNAIIITDSSGNDYSFYSLLPREPEPEPEPEL